MLTNAPKDAVMEALKQNVAVKVFGVGGAGIKVMELLLQEGLPGSVLVAVSTDAESLAASSAPEKAWSDG